MNGAVNMLYDDNLHEISERVGDDLFILPSSVHEVICVPASSADDLKYLADMVHEINMMQVSLEDRLSNQVYHYDRKARTLELATDTPYKRIDGEVAESPLVYAEEKKTDTPKR